MSTTTTSVLYRLVGQDSASRVFGKVGGSASAMDKVFRTAALGAGIVGAALVKAADDAVGFQSKMTKVSTQAGATAKDVKTLSAAVLKLAPSTQQGPDALADSLYHLKSVGLDNADAMKALKTSSDLAALGGANLEDTTNALAGAWRSGIKGASNFSQAAATVNSIIGAGNMQMGDFVAALGTGIAASAKTFGLSLSQVGAALALMTDEGVPATDAATRLRMSFSLLGAPSAAANKVLKTIGLTGLQLGTAMRGPDGIIGAITLLKTHLDASGQSAAMQAQTLSRAFGGGKSSSAIMTLLNNLDVLKQKQQQINATTGNYGAAVAAQRQTAEAQLKILESTLETASIKVGNLLLPPLTKFVGWVNSAAIPAVNGLSQRLQKLVPTAAIRSGLAIARKDFGAFVDGLTAKAAPKAAVKAKPLLNGTSGLALHEAMFGAAVPRFAPKPVHGPTPKVTPAASARLNRPSIGASALGSAQLFAPAHPMPTKALVPDPGPWQKTGKTISGVIADLVKFGGQLALSFRNIVTAATPTAVFLATTLLGALSMVAHILSTIVGPAFLAFTGFLAQHQGTVKFFAEVILGGLILKMTVLGTLRAATAITDVGTAILKFPTSSVSSIGTAFTKLKTAGTDFGTAASGLGTKIKGLGTSMANLGRSVGSLSANAWRSAVAGAKSFGTSAKHAGQDAAQMGVYAGRAIKSMAKNAWAGTVSGAQAAGGALRTAGSNAKTFGTNVGSALVSGGKSAWSSVTSGASAAAGAMGKAATATWGWVTAAAASTAAALKQAAIWTAQKVAALASAVAEGVMTAAQWLLDAAMAADPLVLIVAGLIALVGAIVYVATKTTWFQTAWKATWSFIVGLWNTVYGFLTHGFGQFAILITGPLAPLLFLALHWKTAWADIQLAAVDTWHFIDKWVVQPIATAFSWLWTNAIQPALKFIVGGFLTMAGQILGGAVTMLGWVPGIGGKLKSAQKAFQSFADGVNASLGGIKPKTVPVTVSFDGTPEGKITGHTYTSTTGFSYATGGRIAGPGTGTSDSIPIWASNGEFMVNANSTRKHLALLKAINADDVRQYATGGMIGFTRAATGDMASAAKSDTSAEVKRLASAYAKAYNASHAIQGLSWAKSQVGMPYQWGGNGNPSWDCSGFMSAIESVMRGEAPHRRWATGAFSGSSAPAGWVQGAKAPFTIGITNAGVGHTAGTINGTNVEMSVGGAKVGPSARGAQDSLFPTHYGLVGFDKGGIARGKGYMPKMTHQPERVLSPRQTAAFEQLVSQLGQDQGGTGASFAKLGAAIPAGVAKGVTGGAGTAHAAVQAMAKGTVQVFSSELGIASLSKKYRTLGAYVIDGLVQGLTGSTASVKAATKKIANALYVDFGSGHSGLQRTVATDNKQLLKLAAQRDTVATKLKAANKALTAVQKQWTDAQSSVADNIMQSSTVVVDASNSAATLTASQVVSNFQAQASRAASFAKLLQQAQAHGLNAAMVQQIAASGVDTGYATAQALASASTGQIQSLNAMQKSMQTAATGVGTAVANSLYGAGVQSAKGLVKGLQSQEKAIDAEMLRIAKSMQKSIKAALGIHSPSRVFDYLGRYVPQGVAQGVRHDTHHATSAVRAMSTAVRRAGGGLAMDGTMPVPGRTGASQGAQQAQQFAQLKEALMAAAGNGTDVHVHFNDEALADLIDVRVKPKIRASEQNQARRAKVGRRTG